MPALVYSLTNWLMTWTNINNAVSGPFWATDVALGLNDTYAIDNKSFVWEYSNSNNNFTNMSFTAKKLSPIMATGGLAWIATNKSVYAYLVNGLAAIELGDGSECASDIASNALMAFYMIDCTNNVKSFDMVNMKWNSFSFSAGTPVAISVDSNSNPWVVDSKGNVWKGDATS